MKEVLLPDGSIGEFPDEMPDAEIEAVLQREFPQPAETDPALSRFSQGAISGFTGTLDALLAPTPGLRPGDPGVAAPPFQPPSFLQQAEELGLTQPGALERSDLPTIGGRAASGIPFGLAGGAASGARLLPSLGAETLAAGTSALGEAAGQALFGDVGGTVGAIAGGFVPTFTRPATRAAQQQALERSARFRQAIEAGEELGSPIQQADLIPWMRRTQAWIEGTPLTGAVQRRANRLEGLRSRTSELMEQAQRRLGETKWTNLNQVRRIANTTGPRSKEARALLEAIEATTEDDLDRVIGVSQRLDLFREKLRSDGLYARAAELAQGAAGRPAKAAGAAQAGLSRLSTGALQDTTSTALLERLTAELNQPMSMEAVRVSRSNILEAARDTTNLQTKAILEQVADALNEDLQDIALSSGRPDAWRMVRNANKHYREQVVRRRDSALAKALNKTDVGGVEGQRMTEDVVKQFLNPRRAQQASFTWNILEAKGKAAVKARIYREAFDRATTRAADGTAVFSPSLFANELENYGPFLARIGQTEFQGLSRLMRAVSRESLPGAAPFTGGRVADQLPSLGLGAAAVAAPVVTIPAWLSIRGLQAIFEKPASRGLIAAAAKAPNRNNLLQISARLTAIAGRESEKE